MFLGQLFYKDGEILGIYEIKKEENYERERVYDIVKFWRSREGGDRIKIQVEGRDLVE